ncbi:PAS domain-containing sensor histidine kinase [Sneathiella aquimaris]|uniref:PAS domain-containing sensor histidine kinase n=1 Tax=Sneathiella aquimaris TaxID=2599305 RepID=UPI00146A65D5|nr:PAS-domain containing protein [Sneathiella aquimaris]
MDYLTIDLFELFVVGIVFVSLCIFTVEVDAKNKSLKLILGSGFLLWIGFLISYLTNPPIKLDGISLIGFDLCYVAMAFYGLAVFPLIVGLKHRYSEIKDTETESIKRQIAEHELSQNNKLIAQILEASQNGYLLLDMDYRILFANKSLQELLSIPASLCRPGTPFKNVIAHLADKNEFEKQDTETLFNDWVDFIAQNDHIHYQRKRPDGTILDIENRKIQELGLLSVYVDITKQAIAELKLKKSEEKFRDFSMSASDWMWEIDQDFVLTYLSKLGQKTLGRKLRLVLGRDMRELLDMFEDQDNWNALILQRSTPAPFKDFETVYCHPDGTKRYLAISGKPIFNASGEFAGYRGIGRDVTSSVLVQEQLRQSQKMEAIGRLTGGIAHDFNNLLAILLGNAERLRELINLDETEQHRMLKNIEKATLRGADLTQQLLSFSRKQHLNPRATDIKTELSGFFSLLSRGTGKQIQIKVEHPKDLWPAHTDLGQLENALLNLVNNARDSMPSGGEIVISTRNHIQAEKFRNRANDFPAGDYVAISVTDTGAGIPAEHQEKIFEPFFTTKEIGKGTGLGLSMVFGFIKQSNGHISVQSDGKKGTVFTLFLPKATQAHAVAAE